MIFKRFPTTFVLISLLFAFVGCSSNESKLIGIWQYDGSDETLEFFKDKTVLKSGGSSFTAKWSVLDDGRVKIDYKAIVDYSFIGSFKGDKLILVIEGYEVKLTKITLAKAEKLKGKGASSVNDEVLSAQIKATRARIKLIETAIDSYMLDHEAKLPPSLDSLTPYVEENRSYLTDIWDTEFNYKPNHVVANYTITSAGPDLKIGTEDDISN